MKFSLRVLLIVMLCLSLGFIAYGYVARTYPILTWCEVQGPPPPMPPSNPMYMQVATWRGKAATFSIRKAVFTKPPGKYLKGKESEAFLDNLVGNHDGKLSHFENLALAMLAAESPSK